MVLDAITIKAMTEQLSEAQGLGKINYITTGGAGYTAKSSAQLSVERGGTCSSPRLTVAVRASIQFCLSLKEFREPGDGEAEQSAARGLDEPAVDELLARAAQRLGGDAEATGEGRTRHGAVTERRHGHHDAPLLRVDLRHPAAEHPRHPLLGMLGTHAHLSRTDDISRVGPSRLPGGVADQLHPMWIPPGRLDGREDGVVRP